MNLWIGLLIGYVKNSHEKGTLRRVEIMRLYARSVVLDRKNMTDNLEEYQDWIEYCLNVIDRERDEIIKDNGADVEIFEYGVAVGLGRAIEIILGVEEE